MYRVLLAAESLDAGNGGISRVARLMATVAAEQQRAGQLRADALVLNREASSLKTGLAVAAAEGRRTTFVARAHSASFSHSHFMYDFVGMARAHCRLPLLRRPFLTWMHGIEVWEDTRPDRIAWARRADVLVANSAYTRDRAERAHGGFSRAKVCWLATESDEESPLQRAAGGPPTVTLVARLTLTDRYKGHRELIGCWPRVVAAVPDARLLFVGRGPGREHIQELASRSPACRSIELHGFVPDEDMEAVWAGTTVLAMPSRGEGFGLVYIEAMRHGIPVVASVHDAAPEVNLDGVTGFNVNLDKPDELPERLIFLLKNPDRAVQLGRHGQERWRNHFRYSSFRERFLPILNEFLHGRAE